MEQVLEIQALRHEGGKTYKEIQAALGVSSKTISKALNHPESFAEGYSRRQPAGRPALGEHLERIEELLKGKAWARETGPKRRRVRRTARWVYRQLKKNHGYTGAESTVRAYIRQHFKKPRPACPIEHRPGDEAQFDFGEWRVKIGGDVKLVHFAGSIFPSSTRRFLFAYPAERQECLFDAIERTYQRAGGVTKRATLDNTKLAVKKVLEGRRRQETEDYARFRAVVGVTPRFTNRGAGWEKGHVEGTVGWAKRQVLMDLEVADWDEFQAVLDQACDEDAAERRHGESDKRVAELFAEECGLLRAFPYEGRRSFKRVRAHVSPGGLVHVEGSRYSVPIQLRGRHVRIDLYWDELVVRFNHEPVARHDRDWSGRGEHYEFAHYVALLERAPALLDHGKPFVRMPDWVKRTRAALGDDKALIELLLAMDRGKYTLTELEAAATEALSSRCVSRAVIEQRAMAKRGGATDVPAALDDAECGGLGRHEVAIASPEVYDALLAVS